MDVKTRIFFLMHHLKEICLYCVCVSRNGGGDGLFQLELSYKTDNYRSLNIPRNFIKKSLMAYAKVHEKTELYYVIKEAKKYQLNAKWTKETN